MSTHIDLVDNFDEFDEFDIDCLDIDMLDDLLTDDLNTAPVQAHTKNAPLAKPTQLPQSVPHSSAPSKQQQQRYTHGAKHCQLTIDSLFGKNGSAVAHQREPLPKRPVGAMDNGIGAVDLRHPPAKAMRLNEPQAGWSTEPIDIDSDYGDLMEGLEDDDLLDDSTWQDSGLTTKVLPPSSSHYYHNQLPPTTQKWPQQQQLSPLRPKQPLQMFQAREMTVKSRGDNTLVEETHAMDRDAMQTYLYPLLGGQPARAYQQGAIQRCLFQNTLVALPTGMGKTLIAVVVMANYARWFPNCLSVFLAPTKPLVAQQMQACKGMIYAILSKAREQGQSTQQLPLGDKWIVEMNGSTPPKSRQALWNSARFVFSTPQILQNDLKLGTLDGDNARRIALLVIDEAHRATGKYAYGESVSALYSTFHGAETPACDPMRPSKSGPFRIMALTATPGSNMDSVKEIVQRLHIAHIFLRTEESLDVVPYIHGRLVDEVVVELPPWLLAARDRLADVIMRSINILCNVCHAMTNPGDPRNISGFKIRMDRDRYMMRHQGGGDSGMDVARILSEFTIAMTLAHIMQLLSEHGLRPAWTAIRSWSVDVARTKQRLGSASRAKVDCVDSKEWAVLLREFGALIDALDKQDAAAPGSSTPGPNRTATNLASSILAPTSGAQRTDVVSSFFNVSSKNPSAGSTALAGGSKSIVDIAHKGFLGHPKLERMVDIVRAHFDAQVAHGGDSSTRIIIFSQYRGSVSEIVAILDHMRPLVRCEPFIGQSKTASSKPSVAPSSSYARGRGGSPSRGRGGGGFYRGRGGFRGGGGGGFRGGGNFRGNGQFRGGGSFRARGGGTNGSGSVSHSTNMDSDSADIDSDVLGDIDGNDGSAGRGQTQKEQLAVLARFRKGETNIIVATCVGEEGLDIGEVDLIINYDAPSSPIRLLQRIGRTGRARRGKVVVFLAKNTREEESYKKAQREYKSVQAKIASGKNLMLREDLSPPMLPPLLAPGAPVRTEVHLTKEDIDSASLADDIAKGSKGHTTTAGGSRARGSDKKLWTCEGIDASDMAGFRVLSQKYHVGSTSSVAINDCDSKPELQKVAQLLERGVPWQASESPQFNVAHSDRSSMYCRIMTGIENARFNEDLDLVGNASGAQKSLFHLPSQRSSAPVGQSRTRIATTSGKSAVAGFAYQPAKNKPPVLPPGKSTRPVALAASTRALEDDSDDDLEDVSAILARRPLKKVAEARARPAAATNDDEALDDAIRIDSSPLMEDRSVPWSPSRVSQTSPTSFFGSPTAASRLSLSPKPVKKTSSPKKSPASANASAWRGSRDGGSHQRRPSLQRNLFDTIDSLVKSGKAKPAFDWSMSFDTALLNEAKARRVDLKLFGAVGIKDDVSTTLTPAPVRPAIFGDIGEPGVFDKLYDDGFVGTERPGRMSLVGDLPVPAVDTACRPMEQILCLDSDVELSVDADILDDVDNLSLADLECFTPPVTAIPETPPPMQVDEGEPAVTRTEPPRLPPPPMVVCIDDDDGVDTDLLAFDLSSEELFELSDDDIGKPLVTEYSQATNVPLQLLRSIGAPFAQNMAAQQEAPTLPSSSPLRPRKRASASAGPSVIEDIDATPPLPLSSPVQRQVGRLVRGKPATKSASADCTTSVVTPPRGQRMLKKRKLRPPLALRTFNPFIDNEAGIGDSDDDEDGRRIVTGLRRAARAGGEDDEDDEDGSEDLDQNLSSFIVEDDHIEFETPVHHGHAPDGVSPGQNDVTPRRIGDYYRQSLASETTPVSEIMRRLAEREKQRRWVSDTPTRNPQWADVGSLGLVPHGLDQEGTADMLVSDTDDDTDADHGDSSDFERAEDLFTQAA
ncbi:3'-5' DNA helicase [Coemansia aciculifera]|uniref:DNA helicase n=1 Tax=Coemansia aciculifera TaxID=417176 RepID=A0A9W8IFY0_9FUNG|nr:3'-5' DNA helicase [Coemansia aciculifera]